jgi:hypothetical protein
MEGPMTRGEIEQQLAEADLAVSRGVEHVLKICKLLEVVEGSGSEAATKRINELLALFEQSLQIHIKVRAIVRKEMQLFAASSL